MFTLLYHSLKKKWVSLLFLLMISFPILASDTSPTLNNGQKWRIGYYEGGSFLNYNKTLYSITKELMNLGWIEKTDLPYPESEDGTILWHYLSTHIKSNYLEFPENAFYSSKWNETIRKKNVQSLLQRLNQKKDINILIVAGTQAGQDFVNGLHNTPTFVVSTSNPITAGIIKSIDDHPKNARVTVNYLKVYRQIIIFHQLTNFKNLGVIYENSVNGHSYAGLEQIQKAAKEKEFNIISCYSIDELTDNIKKSEESIINCLNELETKIDALFLTPQNGMTEKIIGDIAKWAIKHKIKTFHHGGTPGVKLGILMGATSGKYDIIGKFEAEGIAKVLNGVPINTLEQKIIEPIFISINLTTANKIDYDPPIILMGVVEEIIK